MKPIPTWSEGVRPEYRPTARIAAPLMQAEIGALRQRVKELKDGMLAEDVICKQAAEIERLRQRIAELEASPCSTCKHNANGFRTSMCRDCRYDYGSNWGLK